MINVHIFLKSMTTGPIYNWIFSNLEEKMTLFGFVLVNLIKYLFL